MEMERAFELLSTFTAEQWGMVTTRQAKELGLDDVTLHRLTTARFLERVRRGVYAATSASASAARAEQAVWLALNPAAPSWERPAIDPNGGVVSHQSAARLHGLGELLNNRLTFTVPKRRDVRDPDVWTKKAVLTDNDVVVLDGLPITTALRTVCDLLDQNIDGSHIATIIREGVEAGKLQLDQLAEHISPYARRYNARPHDGEDLLGNLLSQIGLSISDLAVRRAPPSAAAELARVTQLAALHDGSADREWRTALTNALVHGATGADPTLLAAGVTSALIPVAVKKFVQSRRSTVRAKALVDALQAAGISDMSLAEAVEAFQAAPTAEAEQAALAILHKAIEPTAVRRRDNELGEVHDSES
ncbi:type IV toxin-antitoxin system AbiEi family antitoxin domain-containing protein [Amycolatopsis tolypomycina]|uniref:type IV toxin-antitoxin system AbiEi family antitoxin domain-containing protein n=1 Tax=Amycolatopsis tolypomycina TaxID=208445 RepID=UPI0033B8F640